MNPEKILATVNGKEITQKDVDTLLQSLDPERALQFRSKEGQKRILEELINQQLLLADAVENGMDREEAFCVELERVKENVLIQYAITKLMNTVKVDEEEVRKYYEENKEQFERPESIRASHILVDDELMANKVLKEIKAGMAFEEAASTYSKCPSGKNGGDLGYFTRQKMVKEFEEAAFAMEIGEISKPVKTQFGYHLIKIMDKKEPGISTYDEVRNQLAQQLTAIKQSQRYTSKSEELRKKYEVKINQ